MVLLSFSVKEAELIAGIKIRTTRLCTSEKYALWHRTLPGGDLYLDGWWKPRTKDKSWLFMRQGADLYRLQFACLNGRYWPFKERDIGSYTPMTTGEFRQYLREEGFEDQPEELLRFFERHYAPLEGTVFQSIAFLPVREVL